MGDINLERKINNLSDKVDNLTGGGVTEDELNRGLAKKIDKPTNVTSGKVATADGSGGVTWETPTAGGGVTEDELNDGLATKIDKPTDVTSGKVATADGSGGVTWSDVVSPDNVYSTDEVVIGRWINNKPIYRKVLHVSSQTYTANTDYVLFSIPNIEYVTNLNEKFIRTDGIFLRMPVCSITLKGNSIHLYPYQLEGTGELNVVIEYTKTTD